MDLHGLDLNLLVAFDALMAERNVTRAGHRVGRTQPAMSAALARLRALFGDELLVRGPEGLQPTPRALDLAEPLGRALADIGRTLEFTQQFDPLTSAATVSLGLTDQTTTMLLPRLLDHLRTVAPSISVRVSHFVARDDAIPLLDNGGADVTVGVSPSTTPAGRIRTETLFMEPFVCIVRKGHPAVRETLDLETFLSLSHLLVSPEGDRHGEVDAALAKRGRVRRLAVTLPQMHAAPAVIARSDLIATLLAGVVAASGHAADLTLLQPPLDLPRIPFVMDWHRRNDAHPVQRWLRDCIKHLFATEGPLMAS